MSKKEAKMIEVIALHDLSYIDHKGEPQYRRQSSVPFEIDENNFKQFVERKAVQAFKKAEVDVPAETPADEFADETKDDFAEESKGGNAEEGKSNTLSLKKEGKK